MTKRSVSAELTVQQTAELLRVSTSQLIRLLDDGALPYRGTGQHRRIRREDVPTFQREDAARRDATRKLTEEAQDRGLRRFPLALKDHFYLVRRLHLFDFDNQLLNIWDAALDR